MSTKKLNRFILVVPAVLCIVLAGCSTAYVDHRVVASGPVSGPTDVVESFYSSYASFPGDPMIARAYRSDGRLAPELIQKVDGIINSFDKGGYDPFLCAQDIPGEFAFDDAVVSGEGATVVVHEVWNPGTEYKLVHDVTVALRRTDDQWKINDVLCPGSEIADPLPEDQLPTTPGQVVQAFYGWYIWYAREVGSPLADGAYRSSKYLTPQFIGKVDGIILSFDKGGYDPFLCAQDIPGKFTIGNVDITGKTASIELNEIWNLGTEHETVSHALVKLRQIDERWLIDDVLCVEWDPLALESEPPKATTPEEKVGEATKNKPPVDGGQIEGWQVFRDDEYGFQLRFPEDWSYEEGQLLPPEETPDGQKALKRVLFFEPRAWDGVVPPLHIHWTTSVDSPSGPRVTMGLWAHCSV